MGNPFVSAADGGPCISCRHCKGFRTDPDLWVLCGYGLRTFTWAKGDHLAGCRYFARSEEFSDSSQHGPKAKGQDT